MAGRARSCSHQIRTCQFRRDVQIIEHQTYDMIITLRSLKAVNDDRLINNMLFL